MSISGHYPPASGGDGFDYRLVVIRTDGERIETVQPSSAHATRGWQTIGNSPKVARVWIERRPTPAEWRVCSSELGTEFWAMQPKADA